MKYPISLLLILAAAWDISLAQEKQSTEVVADKLDAYLISANQAFRFNGSALVAQGGTDLLQKTNVEKPGATIVKPAQKVYWVVQRLLQRPGRTFV